MTHDFTGSVALVASVLVHALLAHGAAQDPRVRSPKPRTTVQWVVQSELPPSAASDPQPPQPPPLQPPKTQLPKPPNKPQPPKPQPPKPEAEAQSPEPAPPIDAPEPAQLPPELSGTTLTSDVGASFTALAGNGAARSGAISAGAAVRAPVVPRTQPVATRSPIAPLVVPSAQLSRKPEPPALQQVLERHYPARARQLGQSGEAKVRARIDADGRIRQADVAFESDRGFGTGCRAALLESRWTAPLDARGKPVATWVTYRCKFRVSP